MTRMLASPVRAGSMSSVLRVRQPYRRALPCSVCSSVRVVADRHVFRGCYSDASERMLHARLRSFRLCFYVQFCAQRPRSKG